jgi:hypothetical protein
MPSIARSVAAIASGFVLIAALALVTGAALQGAGLMPPAGVPMNDIGGILLETAYVAIFAIAGCWFAAYLAPDHPMRHALILGVLGLAFNLVSAAAVWDQRPAWAILLNLALVMPYAWIGGRLREQQLERARVPAL